MKDLRQAALMVVDVQNDFCPGGALAVENGHDIVPLINQLLGLDWAVTLASLDWHPRDHVSFAANHAPPDNTPFESSVEVMNPDSPSQGAEIRLWPEHCVAGTHGAALVAELDSSRIQHQVKKGTDARVEMYSCLGSVWGYSAASEAETILRQAGARAVYVVGLAGDYCVKHTALHAAQAGFTTKMIRDATRFVCGDDSAAVQGVEAELRAAGVELVSAASLLE